MGAFPAIHPRSKKETNTTRFSTPLASLSHLFQSPKLKQVSKKKSSKKGERRVAIRYSPSPICSIQQPVCHHPTVFRLPSPESPIRTGTGACPYHERLIAVTPFSYLLSPLCLLCLLWLNFPSPVSPPFAFRLPPSFSRLPSPVSPPLHPVNPSQIFSEDQGFCLVAEFQALDRPLDLNRTVFRQIGSEHHALRA